MGQKVEGLALGLFAALSVPLSALAHLHLRQLDVAQHVGVCGGEKKTRRTRQRKHLIFASSVLNFGQIWPTMSLYLVCEAIQNACSSC